MKNHRLCPGVGVGVGVGGLYNGQGAHKWSSKEAGGAQGRGAERAYAGRPLTAVWGNGGKQGRYGGSPGT